MFNLVMKRTLGTANSILSLLKCIKTSANLKIYPSARLIYISFCSDLHFWPPPSQFIFVWTVTFLGGGGISQTLSGHLNQCPPLSFAPLNMTQRLGGGGGGWRRGGMRKYLCGNGLTRPAGSPATESAVATSGCCLDSAVTKEGSCPWCLTSSAGVKNAAPLAREQNSGHKRSLLPSFWCGTRWDLRGRRLLGSQNLRLCPRLA